MTHPFRFGVEMMAPFAGMSWTDSAKEVEALGYSTLFVPDHFHEGYGPITAMATAAMATTTLKVGPINMPLASPARLAMTSGQIASVPSRPFGPCCSVEPMGIMIPVDFLRYSSISGHADWCSCMSTPGYSLDDPARVNPSRHFSKE